MRVRHRHIVIDDERRGQLQLLALIVAVDELELCDAGGKNGDLNLR